MSDLFTADFYAANRKRLRSLFQGTAPIVITASAELQKGIDESFFRQDGNFRYLTGLTDAELVLVLDKEREYLILPEQSQYQLDFHGQLNADVYIKASGIQTIYDAKTGWKKLGSRLKKVKHVATLAPPPEYIDVYGFYTNPARAKLVEQMKTYNEGLELLDLRQHFAVMRMVKQPEELEAIKQAIDITVKTLKSVKRKLPKYTHEYQVEADISHGFRWAGSDGHAFDPIVAGGGNAAIVHHMHNDSPLDPKDLLLMDVGAQVEGYAADISRTYSLSGNPTKRQRQVYDAVLEVQQFAMQNLKPGVTIRDNEKLVEQFMGEKLRSLGLIKNVERDEIRRFFSHATSHHLGIDVHDIADYDRPLEPGMVLTVEPGIYILEEGIGVRLEDDVLITADGFELLTGKLDNQL